MVFDKLENAHIYYGMHKNMEKSFNFIKEAIEKNLPIVVHYANFLLYLH